jgi:hypothetical protein
MATSPEIGLAPARPEPATERPSHRPRALFYSLFGAAVLIALLARPMVIGRTFVAWDWNPHAWYIWHQAEALRATGLPTLFAHDTPGVFDTHYAFYGGTFYVLGGLMTLLVGSADSVVTIIYVAGFVAAYGGCFWLARQAGLGVWTANAPAVVFITMPHYLALIYATGGVAEFTVMSVIPPLLASGFAVLRADRLRPGPVAVLALTSALFFGSHNLTLLWGGTLLLLVGVALLVLVPGARRQITVRGVRRVACVVVPATLVNAWFLLPDVVYQSRTVVANDTGAAKQDIQNNMFSVDLSHLLSLTRTTAEAQLPHLALQLPLVAIVWVLVGLIVLRSSRRSSWYRTVVILLVVGVVLFTIMTNFSLLWAIPKPYNGLQFAYRLENYIQLVFVGAMIALLAVARRSSARQAIWAWALVLVVAVSAVSAVLQVRQGDQVSTLPEWRTPAPYLTQKGWPWAYQYTDADLPEVTPGPELPVARFSMAGERGKPAVATVDALPGQFVLTNLVTMTELVKLTGARVVAHVPPGVPTALGGAAIVEIGDTVKPGAVRLTVEAAHPWPVVAGWILSLVGLAGLAAVAVTMALGARARRRESER